MVGAESWAENPAVQAAQHPTQVAGVEGSTVAGFLCVAPGANFLSYGLGSSNTADDFEKALDWALDDVGDGTEVYNMSMG